MEQPFNISDLFFESARKYPDKIAIIDKEKQIRFGELEKKVKDTATYFSACGIGKGDRVLIFVPMSIDLYRIVLALLQIGAVVVFLDEWVNRKRMQECCKVAQCDAFIGVNKARVFAELSKELRKIPIKLGVNYATADKRIRAADVYKADTALITFTTGSTGTPKAAIRTHGLLYEQFKALIEEIDPAADDIDMPALPIVLLINLATGCTSVIASFKATRPESMDPAKIIAQINKHAINRLSASPFFIKQLANYINKLHPDITSIKKIFTGGAPVFPSEAMLYLQAFPQSDIKIVYGSTEAEPISFINARELVKERTMPAKGLKAGIPYHKTTVKIIPITPHALSYPTTEAFFNAALAPGEIGEIIVSGPHVLRQYFNNEAALKQNKLFIGDTCWHRTGDSGYLDEQGIVYLTGRCSMLIHSEKNVVSSFIYENIFQSIDGIEAGTVLTLKHRIIAVIGIKKGADKEKLAGEIAQLSFKFDTVLFVPNIPKDPRHHSKIDYEKLKQIVLRKC